MNKFLDYSPINKNQNPAKKLSRLGFSFPISCLGSRKFKNMIKRSAKKW